MNVSIAWVIALVVALDDPPSPEMAPHPGGYWTPGERPMPEPPDGEWKVVTGAILLPLGVLGTAAAAASTYITAPSRCERITEGRLDEQECSGLYAFSWVRVVYSGLIATSGVVFLSIGLSQRKRHRDWEARRMFAATPWLMRTSAGDTRAGLGLLFRF